MGGGGVSSNNACMMIGISVAAALALASAAVSGVDLRSNLYSYLATKLSTLGGRCEEHCFHRTFPSDIWCLEWVRSGSLVGECDVRWVDGGMNEVAVGVAVCVGGW